MLSRLSLLSAEVACRVCRKPVPVLLAVGLLLGSSGCSRKHEPPPLSPQARSLVRDLVQLNRLAILRYSDPDRARALRDSLSQHLDPETLESRLSPLWEDPALGQQILEAVHDSLQGMHRELIAPTQGKTPPATGNESKTSPGQARPLLRGKND